VIAAKVDGLFGEKNCDMMTHLKSGRVFKNILVFLARYCNLD
jgi:hypothetical protein